ncbi:MAG TPA: protein phosphatase CheZ [Stellaceae bacterium]|jgi:chemotaxis regulatin CheY-phosphate phosphatase CheZ|nr:protein phosphatase CheZ [Stellaceae bacterium]
MKVPSDLSNDQYITIENALQSSEAGRAFLRMRDRRAAVIGAEEVRRSIDELRSSLNHHRPPTNEDVHLEVLRRELIEMAASIRKAKIEISAMKPADEGTSSKRINLATEELDAIVRATERATSDILNGAERVLDVAGQLRKQGITEAAEVLDNEATNILVACGFQDITGQRISKVVATLRYLEERVDAMIRIWGIEKLDDLEMPPMPSDERPDSHLLNGPALKDGLDQSVVDALFGGEIAVSMEAGEPLEFAEAEVAPPEPEAPAKPAKAAATPAKPAEPAETKLAETKPAAAAAPAETSAALDQSSIDSMFP